MQKKYIPIINKLSKKNIKILSIVILLFSILTVGMLIAKYSNERSTDKVVKAQEFYFTSNLLDGKEHTLTSGSTSVTFTLSNHVDELRYSDMDIEYTVTVKENSSDSVITEVKGTLEKGDTDPAKIIVSSLEAGKTYTITAKADGGYTKTLTATIVVPEISAKLFYHVENSANGYTLLTVWNEGDLAGDVTIEYQGIPDNTNPNMTNWQLGENASQTQKVTIKAHESLLFRFFGDDVKVEVPNVTEKTPK